MSTQTNNGRAFEWAMSSAFIGLTGYTLEANNYSSLAREAFNAFSESKQASFLHSATIAATHIFDRESIRFNPPEGTVIFNSDEAGQSGDVRDIIIRNSLGEFGISCKNNHAALKHSRLSDSIDFISKWGLNPGGCSEQYWNEIRVIFDRLRSVRQSSGGTALWGNYPDKPASVYWPVLDAWANEILRVYGSDPQSQAQFCRTLISYLFGVQDFYKVMKRTRVVEIQCYNFNRTLARPHTSFPSAIIAVNNLNGGRYSKTISFNHGFSINFRIHNASSRVEPSLKFDITAIGLPTRQVYQQILDVR